MTPSQFAQVALDMADQRKIGFVLLYRREDNHTSLMHTLPDNAAAARLLQAASEELAAGRFVNRIPAPGDAP